MDDDKFITREFPQTNDFPRTRDYPSTRDYPATRPMGELDTLEDKKPKNAFVRFLRFVFVKNIGLKILALAVSGLLWALIVGLGGGF